MLAKLLYKFNDFKRTDLFKTSFWNGIATIIKMAASLISNKIIAIYLGPSGVALLGQFNNFSLMASTIASLGLNNGITKYVSEHKENNGKIEQILSTSLKTILLSTFLTSVIIFIGADYFCNRILLSSEYTYIFYIFAFSLFLFTLNIYLISILNGYKEFRKIIFVNITSSLVSLVLTVFLVIKYGIYGAFMGIILCASLICFITFSFVYKSKWFKMSNFMSSFSFSAFQKLSKYTLMAFVSLFAVTYIQLLIRTYIIDNLSINEAGYWQSMTGISNMYLSLITSTLGIYYLPRLSEIVRDIELRNEIFTGYKFLLPLTILSTVIMFLFRGIIIDLLFAPSFRPMEELFLFQLMGDVFKIAGWLLALIMVAKAMVKAYIITELAFGVLFFCLTIIFLKQFGVIGTTYAYCLTYFIYFICMVIIFRKILILKNK